MQLRDFINAGIERLNGVQQLADHLGLARQHVTNAKAHQRGLPADACVKLSELLNIDLKTIIAASELATERKEEKRAFWLPFVMNQEMPRIAKLVLILTLVTNFVTPTPAEAAPRLEATQSEFVLCKVRSERKPRQGGKQKIRSTRTRFGISNTQ